MLGTFGSELAKRRAESLRADGGYRSARSPGRLRRALGHRFMGAGEPLLGVRHVTRMVRLRGGA